MRAQSHPRRRSLPGFDTARALLDGLEPRTLLSALNWSAGPALPSTRGNAVALQTDLATASATITIPDPTIPTGVTAVGASTTSIQVSWNPVAGAASYNVYEKKVLHSPRGSGSTIYYSLVAGGVTGTSVISTVPYFTGHTYGVTSVSSAGIESPRSALAGASTLYAPTLSTFLWGGAVMSSASVEAGQTLQVTLLGYGNLAPTYTMDSGPATMSVDPVTGIVTYAPGRDEVGYTTATFTATNSVGSSSATFSFHILAEPTIVVTGGTYTFDGQTHAANAIAYGADRVTPIAGTFQIRYSPAAYPTALSTAPYAEPGSYIVQATFTSSDPDYGGGAGAASLTINPTNTPFPFTAGDDVIYARLSPDHTQLQIWNGSTPNGAPISSYPAPGPSGLSFDAGAGNDTLIFDASNGIPPYPITFAGGDGMDTIMLTGTTATDSADVQPGQVTVDATPIITTGVEAIRLSASSGSVIDFASLAVSTPVSLASGGNLVLRAGDLAITGGGALDLAGNNLILDGVSQASVSSIRQWLQNGLLGVTPALSNSAQPPSGTPALALLDNSLLHLTSFAGQSLDGTFSQVLIQSAILGDTNLDGTVDARDELSIIANMGSSNAMWLSGDLNGDGLVSADDLAEVTANLGAGNSALAAPLPAAPLATTSAASQPTAQPASGNRARRHARARHSAAQRAATRPASSARLRYRHS